MQIGPSGPILHASCGRRPERLGFSDCVVANCRPGDRRHHRRCRRYGLLDVRPRRQDGRSRLNGHRRRHRHHHPNGRQAHH